MIIFELGGVNLSKHILVPTYQVNSAHVTKKWTDANEIEHTTILRDRISGEFKMKFFNKDKYLEVLKRFETQETEEGYTPVRLYVNNRDKVESINAFITINPANTMPLYGVKDYDGFTVSIRER